MAAITEALERTVAEIEINKRTSDKRFIEFGEVPQQVLERDKHRNKARRIVINGETFFIDVDGEARLGRTKIGDAGAPDFVLHVQEDQNAQTELKVENATNGTAARTSLFLNQAGTVATQGLLLERHSSSFSGTSDSGIALADATQFEHAGKAGDFIFNPGAGVKYVFEIDSSEAMRIEQNTKIYMHNNPGATVVPLTAFSRLFIHEDQNNTVFGSQNQLLIGNANGTDTFSQIGLGWFGQDLTFTPSVIAHRATTGSGFTKGNIEFGTRNVTTDTAPTLRFTIQADGNMLVASSNELRFRNSNKHLSSPFTDRVDLVNRDTAFRMFDDGSATSTAETVIDGTIMIHARLAGVGINKAVPTAMLDVDQSSGSATIPVLALDQGNASQEMIEFITTIGTGNAIEAVGAKTLTTTHFIKITIPGGLTRYVPAGTIA